MTLDPEDPRSRYEQVASKLRAQILNGDLPPGERLPTVAALADQFGVSKTTIERALDILKNERRIVARQGAGTFVTAPSTRPTGLRPYIEAAFERDAVKIDYFGFSGETLLGSLVECLDKVRSGRFTPSSIDLRIILPDTERPWTLPSTVDGSDSPGFRQRHRDIIERSTVGLTEAVDELAGDGFLDRGAVDIRLVGSPPTFKLYIINQTEAFFGFYPVVNRRVRHSGKSLHVLDLMGKDTELFHYSDGTDVIEGNYVSEAVDFFDSHWNQVAYEPGTR